MIIYVSYHTCIIHVYPPCMEPPQGHSVHHDGYAGAIHSFLDGRCYLSIPSAFIAPRAANSEVEIDPSGDHGKTIGNPLENGGFMGFDGIYPLVIFDIAMENGHRNSEFSHSK